MYVAYKHEPFFSRKIDKLSSAKDNSLDLLTEFGEFNILKYLPRTFTLSTQHSSCLFNIDLLKYTSSEISDFIDENPDDLLYPLLIEDEGNVLSKFELMYQGEKVIFEVEDLQTAIKISRFLNIQSISKYLEPDLFQKESNDILLILKDGIQVNPNELSTFLSKTYDNDFIISTKNHEYKCNRYGVIHSKVIHDFCIKNPTINRFEYDFDDESNEFQTIASLFNFEKIELTKDNIYFLKETAEDLQIVNILDKINNQISIFEKISQTINEQQLLADSIEELFDWLYNIEKLQAETVKDSIVKSFWCIKEDDVRELAAFIIHVIKTDISLHSIIVDLLILLQKEAKESNCLNILIPFIATKVMQSISTKINYCSFIYNMYKKGLISNDDLIDQLRIEFESRTIKENINLICWFLPELIENKILKLKDINSHYLSIDDGNNFYNNNKNDNDLIFLIHYYYPNRIDQYKKMRDSREPDDELTKSLINDDVDTLQSIVSKSKIDISKGKIPSNIFYKFNQDNYKSSYINYSAIFGSVKCFKYLLLNHAEIDKTTFSCAIKGGNVEIIKIVDQKNESDFVNEKRHFKKSINSNKPIILAIKRHQNELFDWIFENKYINTIKSNKYLYDLLYSSAKYGNAHSFLEILNIESFFNSSNNEHRIVFLKNSANNGFYRLFQMALNLIEFPYDIYVNGKNIEFVSFGNLSIFKLFFHFKIEEYLANAAKHNYGEYFHDSVKENYEECLAYAAKQNYTSIVEYYFAELVNKKFKLTKNAIFYSLNNSISNKSTELFNYLLDQFIANCPSLFINFKRLTEILKKACQYKKIDIAERLTELILKNNSKERFNDQFLEAAKSGSIEICTYFVNKNVYIDFEKLSSNILTLSKVNSEIFSLIVDKSDPNVKEQIFHTFLISAIESQNVDLIEYLLKNGSPIGNSLFTAISSNNKDIVDLILKYNKKPSLINKKFNNETPLHFAIKKSSSEIVKRILEEPGIDPRLYDENGNSALSLAISLQKVKKIDHILDFYGENISLEKSMLDEAAKSTLELISRPKLVKKQMKHNYITHIFKQIVQIKGINPNFFGKKYTFLSYACKINNIEIVKILLKNDKIDVNIHSLSGGKNALIIAIFYKHQDIAKLLIEDERTDINSNDYNEQSALTTAVQKKLPNIVELLINNKRFDPDESHLNFAFFKASGEIAIKLSSLKSLDVNYFVFDDKKKVAYETTLISAVKKSDFEKINLIINHPSFDMIKSQLKKAIFISIQSCKSKILGKLLEIPNLDINFSTNFQSLLSLSLELKSLNIIKKILQNPSFDSKKSEIFDAFKKALLMLRVIDEDFYEEDKEEDVSNIIYEILNELIDFDKKNDNLIDLKKIQSNEFSLFDLINNDMNFSKYINFLIGNGIDLNEPDSNGVYSLEYAIKSENVNYVKALIDTQKIDFDKRTIMKEIKANEARFSNNKKFFPTVNNETYLHLAAKCQNKEILEIFLNMNLIDINATDDLGETPLIKSCRFKLKDNILLLFGCKNLDYLHCNLNGKDALRIIKDSYVSEKKLDPIVNKDEYLCSLLQLIDYDDDGYDRFLLNDDGYDRFLLNDHISYSSNDDNNSFTS